MTVDRVALCDSPRLLDRKTLHNMHTVVLFRHIKTHTHLGAQTQAHISLCLGPVHTLVLQVGVLQCLVPLVAKGHIVCVVGFFAGEIADTLGCVVGMLGMCDWDVSIQWIAAHNSHVYSMHATAASKIRFNVEQSTMRLAAAGQAALKMPTHPPL